MPLSVKEDFMEARGIVNTSPKAASALLRMCLQKLMGCLGESGKNSELDIYGLIRKGLPSRFRDALWAVRVIGPRAVPPGEISVKDDVDTAVALFNLINIIVRATISQQRKVNQLYTTLPNQKPAQKKRSRKRARKPRQPKQPRKREIIPKPTILYR